MILLYYVELGLIIGSLIAISITSGMLAIAIMRSWLPWLPLVPTFIALGVEVLILVISIVIWWWTFRDAWKPY